MSRNFSSNLHFQESIKQFDQVDEKSAFRIEEKSPFRIEEGENTTIIVIKTDPNNLYQTIFEKAEVESDNNK